jgi:thioredoxin reductase (NADPH)
VSESAAKAASTEVRDVVIIGSGPSGYTAAIYTARANMRPLVFEGAVTAGGALMQTTEVENFPGFVDGIQGPELMDAMRGQAERFGAELIPDDVISVDLNANPKVITSHDMTVLAKTVIVSTGSQWRTLGLPGEERLFAHGVSACATCDGFFFRDQDIAVVGGGDSAMEEATFLTRFAKSVTLVHRRDSLRASAIMQERAFANPKIKFLWNTAIDDVLGDKSMTGLAVHDTVSGEKTELPFTGLFLAIGHDPRSDLVKGQLELDEDGYVKVASPSTHTNIPGVFACGDVVDHIYRQAITAAGTGCAAALDAERYIADLVGHPDDAPEAPAPPVGESVESLASAH